MRSVPLLAVFAVVVLMQAAAADSWMQPRGDAEATGFQGEDGPEWPDVALHVQLEGSMRAEANTAPLILEDRVLFLARPHNVPGDDDYRIVSVDLETAEVSIVAAGIERAEQMRLATDGETIYVTSRGTVHAFPLDRDGHEWTWIGAGQFDEDELVGSGEDEWEMQWCGWMSILSGNITLLCHTDIITQTPVHSFVFRLDAATGELLWNWNAYDDREYADDPTATIHGTWPAGLAVSENYIVVLTTEGGRFIHTEDTGLRGGFFHSEIWALNDDGQNQWRTRLQTAELYSVWVQGQSEVGEPDPFTNIGNPAIANGAVYAKAGQVHRLNIGGGEVIWSKGIGQEDVDPEGGRSGAVAIGNGHVYTSSAQTIYSINQDDAENGWSRSLDFAVREGFRENPVATPSAVYTVIASPDNPEMIVAFSTEDGRDLWRHEGGEQVWALSVGQGLIAYPQTAFDGEAATTSLVVLGTTEASPVAVAEPSTLYPGPGQLVEVDLFASEAGLGSPVSRYKAIWGDGTETDWQESPVLTHLYTDEADMEARFIVGNDANQTASTLVTFHVGQDPPPELNFLQKMFAPERQDMTFGVLGVLVAVTGGAIGVTKRHRKKNRLKDVLDSVERAFAETSERPLECESQLTERKTHARGLVMDGELDENQFQVVESRIEELRTSLRLNTVEKEFELLPHGVVRSLEEMLKDGRVSTMERDGVLAALEEAEGLTSEYKDLVRSRVNEWYNRDHGEGDVSD